MKTIAWNLNHRASRRPIPAWVASAIGALAPDVVILTEYVEGKDHAVFVDALRGHGLGHVSLSARPPRQNQLLIATRERHRQEPLADPAIHSSVPSNALLVSLESGGRVLGFRMPAYEKDDKLLKRPTWEWLLGEAAKLQSSPTIIAGDFNTAPGDPVKLCGDCLTALVADGWTHALPSSGYSWQGRGAGRVIDHAFLSPSLAVRSAHYSWSFEHLTPDGLPERHKRVGLPDHAMLVVESSHAEVGALHSRDDG